MNRDVRLTLNGHGRNHPRAVATAAHRHEQLKGVVVARPGTGRARHRDSTVHMVLERFCEAGARCDDAVIAAMAPQRRVEEGRTRHRSSAASAEGAVMRLLGGHVVRFPSQIRGRGGTFEIGPELRLRVVAAIVTELENGSVVETRGATANRNAKETEVMTVTGNAAPTEIESASAATIDLDLDLENTVAGAAAVVAETVTPRAAYTRRRNLRGVGRCGLVGRKRDQTRKLFVNFSRMQGKSRRSR